MLRINKNENEMNDTMENRVLFLLDNYKYKYYYLLDMTKNIE